MLRSNRLSYIASGLKTGKILVIVPVFVKVYKITLSLCPIYPEKYTSLILPKVSLSFSLVIMSSKILFFLRIILYPHLKGLHCAFLSLVEQISFNDKWCL